MLRPDGTVPDEITPARPAGEGWRKPSVGVQLTITPQPVAVIDGRQRWADGRDFPPPPAPAKPERLTLWDQTTELWESAS